MPPRRPTAVSRAQTSAGPGRAARRILGVDTGGTFTDVVLRPGPDGGDGRDLDAPPRVAKVPSTPHAPDEAVLQGLGRAGGPLGAGDHVVHGTTVALNALLTGQIARAALVAPRGFGDLLEIGRQDREALYDLEPASPAALVPPSLRFEVNQRSWPDPDTGALTTIASPTRSELRELAARLRRSRAESVAVCLLHAYADPAIEEPIARALAATGLPVTCSATLLPEHREFERFSTALVNAALVPRMRTYLGALRSRIEPARLSILQSNGGTLPVERAAEEPVRVLLSGPAGGLVGAARAAREAGFARLVGLDMGGTSTDVSFHDGGRAAEGDGGARATHVEPIRVAGHPVGVPTLDIHTIGCGGGSLVRVDAGGVLHVGPGSAGADPGPVCYGRSDHPTVTDAHVLLGHVAEGPFVGGTLPLDTDAVARAFERVGGELGVKATDAARGVLDVARAAMRRAVGVMTMQRGQDPRGLVLVAFGGAGGLHAAALAGSLGMRGALVPRDPGALSASGMSVADAIREGARSPLEPLDAWPARRRRSVLRELADQGRASLREAGHAARSIAVEHHLDLRYQGQSFELRLGEGGDPAAAFHAAHERLYGYRLEDRAIELVCLRARAVVHAPFALPAKPRARKLPARAVGGTRHAVFDRAVEARVIERAELVPGHRFEGPALVEEYSGTTVVPPGWTARVTAGGHLLLTA